MIAFLENVDRRAVAALRMTDATTLTPVSAAMSVTGQGVRLVRNHVGDYALLSAPGLEDYVRAFDALPAAPAPSALSVVLTVSDPSGNYLPRLYRLPAPRDPAPAAAGSIFTPARVLLYPAPAARTQISWALIRATVRDAASHDRLPWALVRVLKNDDGTALASGEADDRGEALLAVPGILITMPASGGGGVLTTEIEVKLRAVFDGALRKVKDAEATGGSTPLNPGYVPDPDALAAQPDKPAQLQASGAAAPADTGKLAAGRVLVADILVQL